MLDESAMEISDVEPSLRNVVFCESLKWIFVGGKGGVGKTTCSCALAILLAERRDSVLILSTDPAHNVSDAFNQKFSKKPILVQGFRNLYAMEVDPSGGLDDLPDPDDTNDDFFSLGKSIMQEMFASFPGIDEAVCFGEVMKLVNNMNFSVVVFDTAPTGHTLRLLTFPSIIERGLEKILKFRDHVNPFITQFSSLLGNGELNTNALSVKLDETLNTIKEVNKQFKNVEQTTFICVCIPEFLSLFETERLIQELSRLHMDVHNVVVNQIIPDFPTEHPCHYCESRKALQRNYLQQIEELYECFNITKLYQQESEVRGKEKLLKFAESLIRIDS